MMVEDFTNGSDWEPVSTKNSHTLTDTTMCNGGHPDITSLHTNSSKKRARSYSPLDFESMQKALQPPHKRHKNKHRLSECIVRIPLDRVRVHRGFNDVSKELNSNHKELAVVVDQYRNHKGEKKKGEQHREVMVSGSQREVEQYQDGVLLTGSQQMEFTDGHRPTEHRGFMEKHRGKKQYKSDAHFGLVDTLIVSFQRSLLNRVPVVLNGEREAPLPHQQQQQQQQQLYNKTHHSHDRTRQSHDTAHQSHDTTDQSHDMAHQSHGTTDQSHDTAHQSHDTTSSHDQWRGPHSEISKTHQNGIVDTGTVKAQIHNHIIPFIPPRQQRPLPPGACPGVDGCIGSDGYWYEWTEPINSCQAGEVPIMPYVYFENFD